MNIMGLFSKKLDPNKLVDGALKGLDQAFFTKEEKANHAADIVKAHADFVKSSLNASTTSSKTRRYIAVAIVFVFLTLILLATVMYKFDKDYSKFVLNISQKDLGQLVFMVMCFYFSGYMVSNHVTKVFDKVKTRFKKKQHGGSD